MATTTPTTISEGYSAKKRIGSIWPFDIYDIEPVYINSEQKLNTTKTLKKYQTQNYVNILNSTTYGNELLSSLKDPYFNYGNMIYTEYGTFDNQNLDFYTTYLSALTFNKPSTFSFTPSGRLSTIHKESPIFNIISTIYKTDVSAASSHAILLIPESLFLYPTNLSVSGDQYTLTLNTVLLSSYTKSYSGTNIERKIYNDIFKYLYSKPLTGDISTPLTHKILYDIFAYKFVNSRNLQNDIDIYVNDASVYLEPYESNFKIRPYDIYLQYETIAVNSLNYTFLSGDSINNYNLGRERPELSEYKTFDQQMGIVYDDLYSNSTIDFLIAISSIDDNYGDTVENSTQYLTLNLTSGKVEYILLSDNNNINLSIPKSLELSYKVDSEYFVENTNINSFTNVASSLSNKIITYILPYPPHYYTFTACFSSSILNGQKFKNYGNTTLNFNLSCGISKSYFSDKTSTSVSAVEISSYLVSDFNILKLHFDTFCKNDKIIFYAYTIKNNISEIVRSAYLSALSCYYGPNFNTYYDLNDPIYIPAASASRLIIKYPGEIYGEFELCLAASLSCSNLTQIDIDKILPITFSLGHPIVPYQYPIIIKKLKESENRMDLSCQSLSADNLISTKDLTNSYISWSYAPTSKNVKIFAIDYNTLLPYTEPQTEIISGESLLWSSSTSNICISGYDYQKIVVTLSSQKYNEISEISNLFYDYYYLDESQLTITSSDIKRNKTVNFSLSVTRDYFGTTFINIPSSTLIRWDYDYYNKDLVSIYYRGSSYSENTLLYSIDLSSIDVVISADYSDFISQIEPITFNVYMPVSNDTKTTSYSTDIWLFANDNILNVDFDVQSQTLTSSNNKVYKTRNGENLISRPKTDLNNFIFKGNTDVIPYLKYDSLNWNISTNTNYSLTTAYSDVPQLSVVFSNIINSYNISKAIITLSAYNAYLPNWILGRNISESFTLNFLTESQLKNKLSFNIYSPYTWLTGSSGNITLLNNSNFKTLSYAPTAYGNKKSNSQNFYVSCNNIFDEYNFYYGLNQNYITTLSTISGSIDIPYTNEMYSNDGATIYLTAFKNDIFPEYDGLTFVGLTSSNNEYIGYFPITANTLPFNYTYINTSSAFLQSPKLLEYSNFYLSFSVNKTAMDLDNNIFIRITQKLSPFSIDEPFRLYDSENIETIRYVLSCKYWENYIELPSVDGSYDAFILRIGDPSEMLTVKDSEILTMVLSVSSPIDIIIPESTFNNILTSQYNGDRALWNSKSLNFKTSNPITIFAFSTSVKPELFISSYYSVTGNDIYFQFETPDNSLTYKITSYDLFFGDGLSAKAVNDLSIFKTYDKDGLYNISYNVYYNDSTSKFFEIDMPISIFNEWPYYNQEKIRLLSENQLSFGNELENTYSLDQIEIQPNEWADVDIFNTAITRLQFNLDYLKYNTQTLSNNSPKLFYGWLGVNIENKTSGISWHTKNYKSLHVNYPNKSTSTTSGSFKNLKDVIEVKDRFYVIDDTTIRAFSSSKIPQEIFFENSNLIDELLVNPVSIDIDETGENIYVADNFANKIYKLNLDFDLYPPQMNIQLNIGNFGEREEPNKLNSPTELIYKKQTIFVLDFNNQCIKQYTKDLNWMFTYYSDSFVDDQPITFAIHPETLMLYVLTQNYNIYIFDYFNSNNFEILNISDIDKTENPIKIFFDEYGDFFYILTKQNIYKYTASGTYATKTIIPNMDKLNFISGKSSFYRSILILTKNSVLKFNDIVELFKIGDGLQYSYWNENQIKLNKDDLALDLNYNLSLTRVCQNIKQFRDNLNSKFVLVLEKTNFGIIEYFSIYPISTKNKLVFSDDIENEKIDIGVNEFHIPQVLNREFKKLYIALEQLRDYLEIKDIRGDIGDIDEITDGCRGSFCWSWKAMSCYSLSLPTIKICNINPITYSELESAFPDEYVYAPSKTYGKAESDCCSNVKSPLET